MKDSQIRSIFKALTWRLTGTIDTIIISFIFTGSIKIASSIGMVEFLSKTIIYYIHERIWQKVSWGTCEKTKESNF